MRAHTRRTFVWTAAVAAAALTSGLLRGPAVDAAAAAGSPPWAIRGARVMPGNGPAIEKASVVMRNGLIEDAGPNAVIPADAVVIDGSNLTVYPGLIDMATSIATEPADANAAAGRGGARGAAPAATLVELERARRAALLRADFDAAKSVNTNAVEVRRLTAAGVTSFLAVPASGLIKGQSALVNVAAPPDPSHISQIGDYRQGLSIVKSPVAEHFTFGAGRGGAGGYPGSLLGYIAFVRQSLADAQWQREARAYADRHADQTRPVFEPVLDALAPVLDGRLPAAFEASDNVDIQRALAMAREFKLTPIIVGGAAAAELAADLKAANARVIYSLNFPSAPGRGGRGGDAAAEESMRARRTRLNAPKVPAALLSAGVPFAFGSNGLTNAVDFLRNAGRTVTEGGLTAEAALQAMTSSAATMAGVGDRLGTISKGKIANVIVTDGDLFAGGTRIRHMFVDGYPVEIDAAPSAAGGGGRRGGN